MFGRFVPRDCRATAVLVVLLLRVQILLLELPLLGYAFWPDRMETP